LQRGSVVGYRATCPVASTALALLAILPSAVLIYLVQRYNFYTSDGKRNLMYSGFGNFFGLPISLWFVASAHGLAPEIPPERRRRSCCFLLVIFIEPMQRDWERRLQKTAQRGDGSVQRLMCGDQEQARRGNEPQPWRLLLRGTFAGNLSNCGGAVTFSEGTSVGEHHREICQTQWTMADVVRKAQSGFIREARLGNRFWSEANVVGSFA